MTKTRIILLALIAAIVGAAIWYFLPQNIILRKSAALIDCARMEDGTGRIERAIQAEKLIDLTTEHVSVSYPPIQSAFRIPRSQEEAITIPQQQAKAALTYIMETADWITIDEAQLEVIELEDERAKVSVSFTMDYQVRKRTAQSIDFTGTFHFKKLEKEWLVTGVHFE